MSHLAWADEDGHQLNKVQPIIVRQMSQRISAGRPQHRQTVPAFVRATRSSFDLTRPGIAFYGGIQRAEGTVHIRPVVQARAQILQRRRVAAGGSPSVTAPPMSLTACAMEIAIINIGYADGYLRCFSGKGAAKRGDTLLPVIGPGIDGPHHDRCRCCAGAVGRRLGVARLCAAGDFGAERALTVRADRGAGAAV